MSTKKPLRISEISGSETVLKHSEARAELGFSQKAVVDRTLF